MVQQSSRMAGINLINIILPLLAFADPPEHPGGTGLDTVVNLTKIKYPVDPVHQDVCQVCDDAEVDALPLGQKIISLKVKLAQGYSSRPS